MFIRNDKKYFENVDIDSPKMSLMTGTLVN